MAYLKAISKRSTVFASIVLVTLFAGLVLKPKSLTSFNGTLSKPYLNGVFPSKLNASSWKLDTAFKNLPIDLDPTYTFYTLLTSIPGTNKLALFGKQGTVYSFTNDPGVNQFSQIGDFSTNVMKYADAGVLGFAFHPDFNLPESPRKDEIYIFYTHTHIANYEPLYDRLSRFKFSPDRDSIYVNSEEILIEQYDRNRSHDGGALFFDKDGFLYVSLGDEGAARDSYQNSQKIDGELFSGIIRIDVDLDSSRSHPVRRTPLLRDRLDGYYPTYTQNYMIPNENPWINSEGKYMEEFFAIGLRSPHTMHYDLETERIFVADVGQYSEEEISIMEKGSNGQWAYFEGKATGFKPKPDSIIGIETPPIFSYTHEVGQCIIGGGVYRGGKFPELFGKYIYGDYVTRKIWSLDTETNESEFLCEVPPAIPSGPVNFYFDESGDIYVLTLKGLILKLAIGSLSNNPPEKLSDVGAFSDLKSLTPNDFLMPYNVNTPLWSDGAIKRRWIAVPDTTEKIQFVNDDVWSFPSGTVLIKHFDFPYSEDSLIKLETRFFIIDEKKAGYGVTYKWNDDGTEAYLIDIDESLSRNVPYLEGDQVLSHQWSFPTRNQCIQCHNSNAGYLLGVNTQQLNKNFEYAESNPQNQLVVWNDYEFFQNDISSIDPSELLRLHSLDDNEVTEEVRVRSYLDANCSFCHRPNGVDAGFDARIITPISEQRIVGQAASSYNSNEHNSIVFPGNLERSELYIRDLSTGPIKMPPIGKSIVDTEYIELLKAWIGGLSVTILDSVCYGSDYTFIDNRILTNIEEYTYDTIFSTAKNGIDSLTITIIKPISFDTTARQATVCYGDLFTLPDGALIHIFEQRSDTTTLQSTFGCDSIVVTSFELFPADTTARQATVCYGELFTLPDGALIHVFEQHSDTTILQSTFGCDSIVVTSFELFPADTTARLESVCYGELFTLPDGALIHVFEQHSDTTILQSTFGCDSIVVTSIELFPADTTASQATVCYGELFTLPDGAQIHVFEQRSDTTTLQSTFGCDSIVISEINIEICTFLNSSQREQLRIHPNPFIDNFIIEGGDENTKVQVYDLAGKSLMINLSQSIGLLKVEFEDPIGKGIYLVTIFHNNKYSNYKLIRLNN
jgi:uncharacterized repeat protein (TIGR03806 family)